MNHANDVEKGLGYGQNSPKPHRKLAVCSIICGMTCIGILSLINSVKAEESKDPQRRDKYSKKALRFGIISIVAWLLFLISIPLFLGLLSYLVTFID